MIKLDEVKRQLYKYDKEVEGVFTLAIYIMAYCMQAGFFAALVALTCTLIVMWGDDPWFVAYAGALVFLISGAFVFIISIWFLRAALSLSESPTKPRAKNGRWSRKRERGKETVSVRPVIRVNKVKSDGTQDYLVDGEIRRYDAISGKPQ